MRLTIRQRNTVRNTVTKIGVDKDPYNLAINPHMNTIYTANQGSDSVSVIQGTTNRLLTNIGVGGSPRNIAVNPITNTVYTANSQENTVSVINGTTNRLVTTIGVGDSPYAIAVNPITNTIYVGDGEGVSVIDGVTNKVVVGVTFKVNPSSISGYISCNNVTSPTNQYLYVSAGTICIATPNKGFEFSSWVENLGNNSTRIIFDQRRIL